MARVEEPLVKMILDVCVKEPTGSAFGFVLLALCLPLYWWSRALKRA